MRYLLLLGVFVVAVTATEAALRYTGPSSQAAAPFINRAVPVVRARFPTCTLNGWTIQTHGGYVPLRPGAICGNRPCNSGDKILGMATTDRVVHLSLQMPLSRAQSIVNWELCNACRIEVEHTLKDVGCGR